MDLNEFLFFFLSGHLFGLPKRGKEEKGKRVEGRRLGGGGRQTRSEKEPQRIGFQSQTVVGCGGVGKRGRSWR